MACIIMHRSLQNVVYALFENFNMFTKNSVQRRKIYLKKKLQNFIIRKYIEIFFM